MTNILLFGTQFTPNQINLTELLQLIIDNEVESTDPLVQ